MSAFALPVAAQAQPYVPTRDYDHDRAYDHRYDRYDQNQTYPRNWQTLGERLDADRGRQDVVLPPGPNQFQSIRVLAERGQPVIRRVEIQYLSGRVQVVDVNRPLRANAGNAGKLNITLRGSGHVRRVSVITDPYARGEFSVLAS